MLQKIFRGMLFVLLSQNLTFSVALSEQEDARSRQLRDRSAHSQVLTDFQVQFEPRGISGDQNQGILKDQWTKTWKDVREDTWTKSEQPSRRLIDARKLSQKFVPDGGTKTIREPIVNVLNKLFTVLSDIGDRIAEKPDYDDIRSPPVNTLPYEQWNNQKQPKDMWNLFLDMNRGDEWRDQLQRKLYGPSQVKPCSKLVVADHWIHVKQLADDPNPRMDMDDSRLSRYNPTASKGWQNRDIVPYEFVNPWLQMLMEYRNDATNQNSHFTGNT